MSTSTLSPAPIVFTTTGTEIGNVLHIDEDVEVQIGDNFKMSAKILKKCLNMMLPAVMEKHPEDFI